MAGLNKYAFPLDKGQQYSIPSSGGSIFCIRSGINADLGLYLIPLNGANLKVIAEAPGADGSFYSIEIFNNNVIITNNHNGVVYYSCLMIPLL